MFYRNKKEKLLHEFIYKAFIHYGWKDFTNRKQKKVIHLSIFIISVIRYKVYPLFYYIIYNICGYILDKQEFREWNKKKITKN